MGGGEERGEKEEEKEDDGEEEEEENKGHGWVSGWVGRIGVGQTSRGGCERSRMGEGGKEGGGGRVTTPREHTKTYRKNHMHFGNRWRRKGVSRGRKNLYRKKKKRINKKRSWKMKNNEKQKQERAKKGKIRKQK